MKLPLRNPMSYSLLAACLTVFLGLMAILMGSIIVQFTMPTIGEAVADWVGHSRFAAFIQLLY